MAWNVGRLPPGTTQADRKVLVAYQQGKPLPRSPMPRWQGPTEPYEFFYVSLGYSRTVKRSWDEIGREVIGETTNLIRGLETTVDPASILALWADSVWIKDHGWLPLADITIETDRIGDDGAW